jgi:hypothetical protein
MAYDNQHNEAPFVVFECWCARNLSEVVETLKCNRIGLVIQKEGTQVLAVESVTEANRELRKSQCMSL